MWASRSTVALAVLISGCAPDRPQSIESNGEIGVMTLAEAPAPLEIGPIGYFEDNCARCHGGYGELYARPFVAPTDELPAIVEDMCAGPAMAPLEGRPLAALVDYHVAMRSGSPFVALIGRDETGLVFETMPGVTFHVSSGRGEVSTDGFLWRVKPDGAFALEVERDGARFDLEGWPGEAWAIGR